MKFREATSEDFEFMANHSVSRGIQKHCPEQLDYIYTLEHEDKILGIGGFRMINVTTAWCWIDISDENYPYWFESYTKMREWIYIFTKEHNIKRLQAYVECDFHKALKMIEHLGFKYESTMESFMDDKDAYMYVKLTE